MKAVARGGWVCLRTTRSDDMKYSISRDRTATLTRTYSDPSMSSDPFSSQRNKTSFGCVMGVRGRLCNQSFLKRASMQSSNSGRRNPNGLTRNRMTSSEDSSLGCGSKTKQGSFESVYPDFRGDLLVNQNHFTQYYCSYGHHEHAVLHHQVWLLNELQLHFKIAESEENGPDLGLEQVLLLQTLLSHL